MAYDQSRLIREVRIYLGGVGEEKLPESVIIHWGDFFDSDPRYADNYPYILWKTTLCCIEYLKANVVTSTTATKTSVKEKVGDVSKDITNDFGSSTDVVDNYDDLYKDYLENPWKFGIIIEQGSSVVHINGVDQEQVDKYRNNRNTTSIYNPLPVTAFPKVTGCPWRRNNTTERGRR